MTAEIEKNSWKKQLNLKHMHKNCFIRWQSSMLGSFGCLFTEEASYKKMLTKQFF